MIRAMGKIFLLFRRIRALNLFAFYVAIDNRELALPLDALRISRNG